MVQIGINVKENAILEEVIRKNVEEMPSFCQ